jgi:uncharacterized membrane protein
VTSHDADLHGGIVLERVIFFSDAVFAIAITLLVLDVRLPDAGNTDAGFVDALRTVAPSLAAFALSFAVIAAFWIGHMRTFRAIIRTTPALVALNIVFLAFIALLPFPTAALARDGNLRSAAVLYAVYGLVTASLSTLLWFYAASIGKLLSPLITPKQARFVTLRAAAVPIGFAISIPVALVVGPYAAEAVWILTFPVRALVVRAFGIERSVELSLSGGALSETPATSAMARTGATRDTAVPRRERRNRAKRG